MASATPARPSPRRASGPLGWLTEDTLAGMRRRKALLAYLFLAPTILGILTFTAGPVIASFALSFFEWDVFSAPAFVGMDNFSRLVSNPQTLTAFSNTARFVLGAVTLELILALALALGVQQKMSRSLRYYFRTAYFIPLLTSAATISIVMAYMFNRDFGVVNYYLGFLGIPRIPWLTSSQWVLTTIILVYVWHRVGFTFIVFTGGLGNISREILEAADVDGAQGWQKFRYITLPMISPTLLFTAVVGVISALQIFTEPQVMTKGGPGDASRTVVMIIYESAFKNLEIGYGSAIAVVLFIAILLVTAFQFWLSKRWVFYQ
jgi:multiple sugar transport system permease protein